MTFGWILFGLFFVGLAKVCHDQFSYERRLDRRAFWGEVYREALTMPRNERQAFVKHMKKYEP